MIDRQPYRRTSSPTVARGSLLAVALLIAFCGETRAEESAKVYEVTYVSFDHVYLSGGRADGIAVGDPATLQRDGHVAAKLEIAFVATHSASCRVLQQESDIRIGDSVTVFRSGLAIAADADTKDQMSDSMSRDVPGFASGSSRASRARLPQFRGHVGVRSTQWADRSDAGLDFSQSTINMNLRARNLWHRQLSISVRGSGRQNGRSRAYSSAVPRSAWSGSLYEAALTYGHDQSPVRVTLGRMIPRRIGRVGRIDGVLAEGRLTPRARLGIFAGINPRWQYASVATELKKYGGYFDYESDRHQSLAFAVTLAAAAEYHGSTVSREVVYVQGRANNSGRWNINANLEFDINRGWRKESAGMPFTLTSVYAITRYRITPRLSASVNFDNRRNYRSYQSRSVADSLFDDKLRRGLRVRWDVAASSHLTFYYELGYRSRDGDDRVAYSYRSGARTHGLLSRSSLLLIEAARFTGLRHTGYSVSAHASESLWRRNTLGVGYSLFGYDGFDEEPARLNRRIDLSVRADLGFGIHFDGQYQFDSGDDTIGHRTLWGIGYTF